MPSGGDLLKQCFTPAMHPLRRPANVGLGDTLSQWIGNIELTYSVGDSTETREITVPSEHTHATVINPLYGLRGTGDLTFRLDELVDWSSTPIRCSQWLKAKVLQINDLTMTAETLLRMMANREGAHVELNEFATMNIAAPMNVIAGDPEDEAYRRAHVINFSGITYVQIFTFLTGFYLAKMMQATLRHIPEDLTRFIYRAEIWRDIVEMPTAPAPVILKADRTYHMGAILQNVGSPGESIKVVDGWKKTGETLIQIPGWGTAG